MPSNYSRSGGLDSRIIEDGDTGFSKYNDRFRPDQLDPGTLAYSQNGRMEINGEWRLRKGIDVFSSPVVSPSNALTLPFYVYEDVDSTSVSDPDGSGKITITFGSDHSFVNNTLAFVSGITGLSPTFEDRNYIITVVDSTNISITITGATGTAGGTATVGAPRIEDNIITRIFGSLYYSDPNTANDNYVFLATNSKVDFIDLSDGSTGSIGYPNGRTLSGQVEMLQAFNKVFIFEEGKVPLVWKGGDLQPEVATFTWDAATDNYNVTLPIDYFEEVETGDYTQPVRLGDNGNNTVISDNVVTVDSTDHGLSVGDEIVVVDAGGSQLEEGEEYVVASIPDDDTFTFYAEKDNDSSHNSHFTKKVSVSGGYAHMPAPRFATYHNRRLWMPWEYVPTSAGGYDPHTDNDGNQIRDELITSDILDHDTYDQIFNQFRVNAGKADRIVGMLSFSDNQLIVFNRNSIHLILKPDRAAGVTDLRNYSTQLLTSEIGCSARRSIVQIGPSIFFLSDSGVYGVSFQDLYNLRGNQVPLSEPIQGTINRINRDAADKAIGLYFNNRYYLAVPLDDSPVNNAIIVFNFLNGGWESLDTIPAEILPLGTVFDIENMFVGGDGDDRAIYIVNETGALHKLEARENGKDNLITFIGQAGPVEYDIQGVARTRQYTMRDLNRKKFRELELHLESNSNNAVDIDISGIFENPDATTDIGSIFSVTGSILSANEDISLRTRTGNQRAYGMQVEIKNTQGEPRLRAAKISAIVDFRSTISAD